MTLIYTEKTGSSNPFNGINVGYNSNPSLVDLNGDGKLDVVVGESNGTLFYYEASQPNNAPTLAQEILDQNTTTNKPFQLNISQNFADIDTADILTYSAQGLAQGLTIDAATGIISGSPTTAGSSDVTITATDKSGANISDIFKLTVASAGATPGNDLL